MKAKFVFFCVLNFSLHQAFSQGCIAIRNLTGFGQFMIPEYGEEPVKWMVNVNTRYFRSYEEFDGSTNLQIVPEDQKVNHVYVTDISVTKMLDKGWSFTVDVPFTAADRTAWQEHENDPENKYKRTTRSFGLSDIRVTLYKWLFDVSTFHKGNIQLGLGLKLPTGDYRFQDYFYKQSGRTIAPVNQSIQLGDGGTGISLELNTYYTINKTIGIYGNFFYLFNPRDVNGTLSGFPQDAANLAAGATVNSVPDAYTWRAGGNLTFGKTVIWAGVRDEGLPVHDVIGSSNGNRRPGKIISVEPGINYKLKACTVYGFVPFPIYRATKQSVPDEIIGRPSPGGFADYMIFVGVFFNL